MTGVTPRSEAITVLKGNLTSRNKDYTDDIDLLLILQLEHDALSVCTI